MRADLLTPNVPMQPVATRSHTPATVSLEVVNTGTIIDQIVCEMPGLDPSLYEQRPVSVTLFPEERATVTLALRLPTAYPSGFHEFAVDVHGRQSETITSQNVLVEVLPVVAPTLDVTPGVLTKGSKGRFRIDVGNRGNSDIEMVLRATDSNQLLKIQIVPSTLKVSPGETGHATLTVRRLRPFFGGKIPHDLAISAEQLPDVINADVKFQQKPRFPSGLITALLLALIVAIWAVAVYVGVQKSMSSPPPKKAVPAAFKTGIDPASFDPAVVGADVSGLVTASTTGAPLPRITVELVDEKGHVIAAGATKKDGTYQLPGVMPGSYFVHYRAAGYVERWFPAATSQAGAEKVLVIASTPSKDVSTSLAGDGATLTGKVIAGDDSSATVTIIVEAVDLVPEKPADGAAPAAAATATGKVLGTQTVKAGGTFRMPGLPSPANYRVRVSAPGFQPQEIQTMVEGGAEVSLNVLRLSAGAGTIGGVVVDGTAKPIGDVEVTTTLDGKPVKTTTPTAGTVGAFSLAGLASPATYVVTFSKPGLSDQVVAVKLGPGEQHTGLQVIMAGAAGSLSGKISAPDGTPIGGALVAVVGGTEPVTTTSFTSGTIGGYRLAGLRLPGSHTVTFKAPGFLDQTVRVEITKDAPEATADIVLKPSLSRVNGSVKNGQGLGVGGATIEVSDGATIRRSATASVPVTSAGNFDIDALPAGSYTITVRASGYKDQTLLVTLDPGATLAKAITMVALA
jgi:hypothetical protein